MDRPPSNSPGDPLATDSATVANLAPTESEGATIGRYKLLQVIGEGGFGVVYMAEQTEPVTRRVALKIIKLGMDTRQVIARFEAERQALALMDHPNIAKVLDAGATDTGRPYFVMELVRGIPITEYCDKNHLPPRERLELFRSVCQAIHHAHEKGVIHRDIKPSNVLVTLHDGKPLPMVIDFGIAKAIHQKLTDKTLFTNFATMIGTPAYMSPEQAEMSKLDVDRRSDIYSLGVLLYELLTGTTPFPERRLREVGFGELQRILAEEEPPRPSTRLSTMDAVTRSSVAKIRGVDAIKLSALFRGDLDWIVMKCLEKDRTRRYESAAGVAEDVQRNIANEPVLARPPTAAYRARKFVRRNRTALAIGAAVCLGIAGGALFKPIFKRDADGANLPNQAAPTANREAYNLYLKGKLFFAKWTRDGVNTAIEHLRNAIALDPDFALAHAALAEVQVTGLYESGKSRELLPIIQSSAERALALDPNLAEAHYSLGVVNLHLRKWSEATANFARALELNPNHAMSHDWQAWLLAAQGRCSEAVATMRRAYQLDPVSTIISPDLAYMLAYARKADEAIQQCRETLKMDPVNFQAHHLLGHLYFHKRDFEEARRWYESAAELNKDETIYPMLLNAKLAAAQGRREESTAILGELVKMHAQKPDGNEYVIAVIHAELGNADEAFKWLNIASDNYDPNVIWLKVNPEWDRYRNDPRYPALLQKLGLDAYEE